MMPGQKIAFCCPGQLDCSVMFNVMNLYNGHLRIHNSMFASPLGPRVESNGFPTYPASIFTHFAGPDIRFDTWRA